MNSVIRRTTDGEASFCWTAMNGHPTSICADPGLCSNYVTERTVLIHEMRVIPARNTKQPRFMRDYCGHLYLITGQTRDQIRVEIGSDAVELNAWIVVRYEDYGTETMRPQWNIIFGHDLIIDAQDYFE